MNRRIYAVGCLCMGLAGCASQSVMVDAVRRPLPELALRPSEKLDLLQTGSRQELELWIAAAATKYGMCVSDKKELASWILKEQVISLTSKK
jgi:hypothetical protein